MKLKVEIFKEPHYDWAKRMLKEYWGSQIVVSRGRIHQADILPGFVSLVNNEPLGLITYKVAGRECEIVTLNALMEKHGIGTALLAAVQTEMIKTDCRRIWLITTNDNCPALSFYQKRGFEMVAVYRNAIVESRKLKPEIPLRGVGGITIRDEIELEKKLTQ